MSARRQPLLNQSLLRAMAERGVTLNLSHVSGPEMLRPSPELRAWVRAKVEGLIAYHVEGNAWVVPSGSQDGEAHKVMIWGDRIACTCDAGKSRLACKHASAVREALKAREAVA